MLTTKGSQVGRTVTFLGAGLLGLFITLGPDGGDIAAANPSPRYSALDLGTLGGDSSFASAINDRGEVVGWSETATGETRGFVWSRGTMRDLGTLGGAYGAASAINDRGQIVGSSTTPEDPGSVTATLWDKGRIYNLGRLPGSPASGASDINHRGQIIGSSSPLGFIWDRGVMQAIGTFGGDTCHPEAINDRGQVVGSSLLADNATQHAFLWENGVMHDLGTLGGAASVALAINNRGQVVGYSQDATGRYRPFLWERGRMTQLATSASDQDVARGISNRGLIAGSSSPLLGGRLEAVLWDRGWLTALPHLVDWEQGPGSSAHAVNDRGQAVGLSWVAVNISHAVLWE